MAMNLGIKPGSPEFKQMKADARGSVGHMKTLAKAKKEQHKQELERERERAARSRTKPRARARGRARRSSHGGETVKDTEGGQDGYEENSDIIGCDGLLVGGRQLRVLEQKERGAMIGGVGGAVAGGVIGHAAGSTMLGAIIGAAVGGRGRRHYRELYGQAGRGNAAGSRRGRDPAHREGIKITFDSGVLFDIDKSDLRPVSETNLTKLATILNKYPDTNILIEGHTDNTGTDDYNMALSKDRAQSVSSYLATVDVKSARFSIAGYGETQPIVTNDSPEGRQKNRRVDIAVIANDKLKKAAEEKAKG